MHNKDKVKKVMKPYLIITIVSIFAYAGNNKIQNIIPWYYVMSVVIIVVFGGIYIDLTEDKNK